MLRESAADAETEKARQAALQYAEDFSEHVTKVHHGLLDFISRGVLHAEITDAARTSRLAALGFAAGPGDHDRFTLNQMMSSCRGKVGPSRSASLAKPARSRST